MKRFCIGTLLVFIGFIIGLITNPIVQTEEISKHLQNNKEIVTVKEVYVEPKTEKQTENQTQETEEIPFELELVEHSEEMIDYGYIKLEDCIPLADITGYYYNEYDYPCFELGDIRKQFDDVNGISYQNIMDKLPNLTEEYKKAGIIK